MSMYPYIQLVTVTANAKMIFHIIKGDFLKIQLPGYHIKHKDLSYSTPKLCYVFLVSILVRIYTHIYTNTYIYM